MKPSWCGPLIYHIHVCWEGHVPNVSLRSMFKLRRVCPPWILSPSAGRKSISQKNFQWSFSTSLAKRFQMQAVPVPNAQVCSARWRKSRIPLSSGFAMPQPIVVQRSKKKAHNNYVYYCVLFKFMLKRTTPFSNISYDHMIHNFDATSVKIGLERFRSWQTGPHFATDQAL